MTRRQISAAEKAQVLAMQSQGGTVRCFVDNAPMTDPTEVEFHHIRPYSEEGPTEISNIGPVCREHHRRIRTLSLTEFRDQLQLESLFQIRPECRLDDLLAAKVGSDGFGQKLRWEEDGQHQSVVLYLNKGVVRCPLETCPATGVRYFYASLPVQCLRNDAELQPRILEVRRVWELYRHLLVNPQLAPAICRLTGGHVLLFDGQHKSAAQVWAGRNTLDCKVYVDPDVRLLKDANLIAHDKLRQMPFYTSTLIAKYSDIFREEWQGYLERPGGKTESGFVEFLRGRGKSRAEALKMMRMAIWAGVLDDTGNKMADFIAEKNRARNNPLTISLVQKTFLTQFLAPSPLNVEFEGTEDKRSEERENIVTLMNIVAEETLVGRWNPEANNAAHKMAERMYFAGAVKAWVPMLRDVVAQVLGLYDEDERSRVFFRRVEGEQLERIRQRVRRMVEHKIWIDPDPEVDRGLRVNNEGLVRRFLNEREFTVNWVLGGKGA